MNRIYLSAYFIPGACLFLLLALQPALRAQTVVNIATSFIARQQFDAANFYLDSVLKKQPKNVDALMMKGNVILNRDLLAMPNPRIYNSDDESIFNAGPIATESRKIVPPKTARQVEALWRQCLKLDSSRVDIYKGLCTLYAMALMTEDLKAAIIDVKAHETDDGEQAYRLADYARKVKDRGKFNEGMEIYRFIARLYPHLAGLRCDMASEYFYAGYLPKALEWLDSTYNFKTVDETSFLNGAFIYCELGLLDNAQDVLNAYSRIYKRQMDRFFFGVRKFAEADTGYYSVLKNFVETADSNSYFTEMVLARWLLACRDTFTPDAYRTITGSDLPPYYKALIYYRGVSQFKDNCEPYIIYGVFQSSIKNYAVANQYLPEGGHCKLSPERTEYWTLNFAYAMFMEGRRDSALLDFMAPLLASVNTFNAHAAKYFTAKILIDLNRKEEAALQLKELINAQQDSKYKELAAYLYDTVRH